MKEYIEERAVAIANYIIDCYATVRQTAKTFGISKSGAAWPRKRSTSTGCRSAAGIRKINGLEIFPSKRSGVPSLLA